MSDFPMSDHAWGQEQVAAYVAGGLDAMEVERFEAHVRDCHACTEALDRARRLDRGMIALFATGLPGPDLEDRTVQAFRTEPIRLPSRKTWRKRALVAASIAAVVSAGGVVASHGASLPMPGSGWGERIYVALESQGGDRQGAALSGLPKGLESDKGLTNEDLGFQGNLESALALPLFDPINKQSVDAVVTQDNLGQPNSPDSDPSALKLPGLRGSTSGNAESSFRGRSGATTSKLLKEGGGNGRETDVKQEQFGVQLSDGSVRYAVNGTDVYDGRLVSDASPLVSSPAANSLGYYPPERADIVRGTSRSHAPSSVKLKTSEVAKGTLYGNYYSTDPKPVMVEFGESRPKSSASPASSSATAPALPATSPEPVPAEGEPLSDKERLFRLGINTAEKEAAGVQPAPAPPPAEAVGKTVVIRSGEIEFEIDSFDASAATVTKLVNSIKGATITTDNREKLSNGKVKGSITVRVPPEQLDGLVLDLRRELGKVGELKGSRIGAQDITKQYTDLESRLKAAKAMVERFSEIIKSGGKGDIKGLVEAEQALGKWLTQIEEIQGELRYYSNLVALSTLTITLTERNIQAAAGITESEQVQAGVEVEDVEKAQRQILDAVAEAKGRVTKSELKQHSAGQFGAILHFEVAPEAAGPLRDRLRQVGRVARMEIDRVQTPEGTVTKNAKVQRGDTIFKLQLYNLANIAPREVAVVQEAVLDVPAAYRTLREAVSRANGRVLLAQINEQDQQNVTAQIDFEVRRTEEAPVRAALDGLGEVLSRNVARAADTDNVTDTKVMYRTNLVAATQLKPRERVTLAVEVAEVDKTVVVFGVQAAEVRGRQVDAQFARDRAGRLTAKVVYEVPLAAAAGLTELFKSAGVVRVFQSARDAGVPEGKYATARLEVTVTSAERIAGADEGLWPQVRRGLSYSVSVLLTSITWVVFGLCVVLPWALIGFVGYRVIRGMWRSSRPAVASVPPTSAAGH